jgi:hypothetical protein
MTKEEILKRVAAIANGEATAPTGDELLQWGEFLETSNKEWSYAYDFQSMIRTHQATILQSGTSVALPSDFKEKFAGYIDIGGKKYEEFDPVEGTIVSGDYVTWGGNTSDGYYMKVSHALYSTCATNIPYHSFPTSLSTLTSVTTVPDPEFLVARTAEMVLLQRGQPEYVEFQAKADLLLQRMVANEVSTDLQKNKTIRTTAEYNNFTYGED